MSSAPTPTDPLKAWREWFVKSEREWSQTLTGLMKEDSTARAVGQEITAALHAQQVLKQGMAGSLAAMNLPTQDQLVALGERLGALEDAVARVEAGVVQLRHALGGGEVPKVASKVGRGLKAPRAVGAAKPGRDRSA